MDETQLQAPLPADLNTTNSVLPSAPAAPTSPLDSFMGWLQSGAQGQAAVGRGLGQGLASIGQGLATAGADAVNYLTTPPPNPNYSTMVDDSLPTAIGQVASDAAHNAAQMANVGTPAAPVAPQFAPNAYATALAPVPAQTMPGTLPGTIKSSVSQTDTTPAMQAASQQLGDVTNANSAVMDRIANRVDNIINDRPATAQTEADEFTNAQADYKNQLVAPNSDMNDYRQALHDRISEMNTMQPYDFWADKTTGQKLMMGIGLAFGGLGGNGNAFADNLQRTIHNEMAAHQQLWADKLNQIQANGIGIDKMIKIGQAAREDLAATQASIAHRYGALLDAAAANVKDSATLAAIQKDKADMQGATAQALFNEAKSEAATRSSESTFTQMMQTTPPALRDNSLPLDQQAAHIDAVNKAMDGVPKQVLGPENQQWYSMNKEQAASKASEFLQTNVPNLANIEKIESNLNPAEMGKLQQFTKTLAIRLAQANSESHGDGTGIGGLVHTAVGGLAAATAGGNASANLSPLENSIAAANGWDNNTKNLVFHGDPEQAAEALLPGKGGAYYRSLSAIAHDRAELASPRLAANQQYILDQVARMAPGPGTDPNAFKVLVQNRRNVFSGMRTLTGSQNQFPWEYK